jgi:hypothetical protein
MNCVSFTTRFVMNNMIRLHCDGARCAGVLSFCFVLGGHCVREYGFLDGRENMDTQFVRMLDTASCRASLPAMAARATLPDD